jgi:transcriptional regulator with XRE-family HTH domain
MIGGRGQSDVDPAAGAAFTMAHDFPGHAAEPERFSQLLKGLRVAADLTQEDLAERAGISARGVSDLERGLRTTPRRDTIQLLADALRLAGADREAFVAAARGRSPSTAPRLRATLPLPPTPLVDRSRRWRRRRRSWCGRTYGS